MQSTIHWIDALTTLPDDDITVLIADTEGDVTLGFHDGDAGWRYCNASRVGDPVLYWADVPEAPSANEVPIELPQGKCSVSVGPGQHAAAALWKTFKDLELTFADMLETAACLIVNVADKTESSDHDIHSWVRKLTAKMRAVSAQAGVDANSMKP